MAFFVTYETACIHSRNSGRIKRKPSPAVVAWSDSDQAAQLHRLAEILKIYVEHCCTTVKVLSFNNDQTGQMHILILATVFRIGHMLVY